MIDERLALMWPYSHSAGLGDRRLATAVIAHSHLSVIFTWMMGGVNVDVDQMAATVLANTRAMTKTLLNPACSDLADT